MKRCKRDSAAVKQFLDEITENPGRAGTLARSLFATGAAPWPVVGGSNDDPRVAVWRAFVTDELLPSVADAFAALRVMKTGAVALLHRAFRDLQVRLQPEIQATADTEAEEFVAQYEAEARGLPVSLASRATRPALAVFLVGWAGATAAREEPEAKMSDLVNRQQAVLDHRIYELRNELDAASAAAILANPGVAAIRDDARCASLEGIRTVAREVRAEALGRKEALDRRAGRRPCHAIREGFDRPYGLAVGVLGPARCVGDTAA